MVSNTTFAFSAYKKSSFRHKKRNLVPTVAQPSTHSPKHMLIPSFSTNFTSMQPTSLQHFIGTRLVYKIFDRVCYTAIDCYHKFDFSYQGHHSPTIFAVMVVKSNT